MRTLLKRLIPVLALFVCISAHAEYRIATVDLGRVFTNYWKFKQAQVAIEEKKSDIEKRGREMMAEFDKSKEDYQKMSDNMNDPAVSSQERDKRKKAVDEKLKELKDQNETINDFSRGADASIRETITRTRDNIVSEIRTVITAKAKADGYTLVIDTASQSANGTPVILYAAPADNDITDAIIKQINVGAPVDISTGNDKPAAKPDDKAAPKLNDKMPLR
jgi:outer membrane protein